MGLAGSRLSEVGLIPHKMTEGKSDSRPSEYLGGRKIVSVASAKERKQGKIRERLHRHHAFPLDSFKHGRPRLRLQKRQPIATR